MIKDSDAHIRFAFLAGVSKFSKVSLFSGLNNLFHLRADDALLSAFDVEHIATEALLWQTGYLTFTGMRQIGARREYSLGYPNLEVETALNDSLTKAFLGQPGIASELTSRLYDVLVTDDLEALRQHLVSLYAAIPHHWHDGNDLARFEGFYGSVFYSHLAALGLDLAAEDASSHGRLDLRLRFNGRIWLFEFKVVQLVPDGTALQQIKAKGYAEKYRAEGLPIHLIGIEFCREKRTLVGFEVETLD